MARVRMEWFTVCFALGFGSGAAFDGWQAIGVFVISWAVCLLLAAILNELRRP